MDEILSAYALDPGGFMSPFPTGIKRKLLWPFFLVLADQVILYVVTSFPSPAVRVCHDILQMPPLLPRLFES